MRHKSSLRDQRERLFYWVRFVGGQWVLTAQNSQVTLFADAERGNTLSAAFELALAKSPASVIIYREDGMTHAQQIDF